MSLVDDALKKEYGIGVFSSANKLIDKKQEIIKVSPTLDLILGGGIPAGSFVVITGKPKLGKSTLCLHIAAKAQAMGFTIYYLNIEGRLKKRDLLGIPNLDLSDDKFVIIGSDDDKILTAEEYLEILVSLVKTKKKALFIADSISQLCSEGRHSGKVGDRFRDDVPLMLAGLTKIISNILPIRDNILICITHIIANQSGMGHSQTMEASGQKVQYQADIKLQATHKEDHLVGEKKVGQLVHWRCDTSALNGSPGAKGTSLLRYGEGIDECYDLLSLCVDIGLVTKKGAWFTFHDESKAQGMEGARNALAENPELFKELKKKFEAMFV